MGVSQCHTSAVLFPLATQYLFYPHQDEFLKLYCLVVVYLQQVGMNSDPVYYQD